LDDRLSRRMDCARHDANPWQQLLGRFVRKQYGKLGQENSQSIVLSKRGKRQKPPSQSFCTVLGAVW
jgi:hypothetical protein